MTRKKIELAYIACDSARKTTFKKRKKGLLKKIHELTVLCGVDACAVLFSPYDPEPVVWPGTEKALKVIEEFRELPEMDQHRKMFNHPTYLKQRVTKATQQLMRLQRDNREREVKLAMYGCIAGKRTLDGLSPLDLNDLGWMVERTLKEISFRLENLKRDNKNINDNDNFQNVFRSSPPLSSGFSTMLGDEEGPNYLGLGFGNAIDVSMQMGPPMWSMDQYYKMASDGNGSGSGGNNGYN